MVLTSALLIIILFNFYRRTCCRNKKIYGDLFEGINKELENNELYSN